MIGRFRLLGAAMVRASAGGTRALRACLLLVCLALVCAVTVVSSLTMSPQQRADSIMGPNQTAVLFSSSTRPSDSPAWQAVYSMLPAGVQTRSQVVWSTTVVGKRIWGGVSYTEAPALPLALASGRLPAEPGEAVITPALADLLARPDGSLALVLPQNRLTVVGIGWPPSARPSANAVSAFPGTIERFDWPAIQATGADLAFTSTLGWDDGPDAAAVLAAARARDLGWMPLNADGSCAAEVCVADRAAFASQPRRDPIRAGSFGLGLMLSVLPALMGALLCASTSRAFQRQASLLKSLGVAPGQLRLGATLVTVRTMVGCLVIGGVGGIALALAIYALFADRMVGAWHGGFTIPLQQLLVAGIAALLLTAAICLVASRSLRKQSANRALQYVPRSSKPGVAIAAVAALAGTIGLVRGVLTATRTGDPQADLDMAVLAVLGLLCLVALLPVRGGSVIGRWRAGVWQRHRVRAVAAAAAIAVAGGYAGFCLTLLNSDNAIAQASNAGGAPAGTFSVEDPRGTVIAESDIGIVAAAVRQTPTLWRRAGVSLQGDARLPGGPLMVVADLADAATILRRDLTADERQLLSAGGALAFTRVYGPDPADLGELEAAPFDDPASVRARLPVLLSRVDPAWANMWQGLILQQTLLDMGATATLAGALFSEDGGQADHARAALASEGRWDRLVGTPVPYQPSPLSPKAMITLLVSVLIVMLLGAGAGAVSAIANGLRADAAKLLSLGASPRTSTGVLWHQTGRIAALGMAGAAGVAVLPLLSNEAATTYRFIFVPYQQWLACLGALLVVLVVCAAVQARKLRPASNYGVVA